MLALASGVLALGGLVTPARAQFRQPPPVVRVEAAPSVSAQMPAWREDVARHVYAAYAPHIYRGQLPAWMHAVAVTETDVDADGRVLDVRLTREPAAAKDVGPWVVGMIRQLGQLPAPRGLRGDVAQGGAQVPQQDTVYTWVDIWLVDKSGRFQLDSLTEGQQRP
ncbi:MAG: hypothetical protein CFE46_02145 [Burkholderiales bacterium PBB6]|nr:MAG: hypothetical protein CFE46_02145 [Burkholderiales bacterium PBB6]